MLPIPLKKMLLVFSNPKLYLLLFFIIMVMAISIVAFIWGVFHGVYNGTFEYTGNPAEELLNDRRLGSRRGNRAIEKCIAQGDASIIWIWKQTKGLKSLEGPQTVRVASLLVSIETPLALAAGWRMWRNPITYSDEELKSDDYRPHELVAPKLAGGYVLARKGIMGKEISDELVKFLNLYDSEVGYDYRSGIDYIYQSRSLIVLSLAHARESSVSFQFVKLLKRIERRDGFPEVLLEACAFMDDPTLIVPLREQFEAWNITTYNRDTKEDQTMDFGPRILRSLLLLEDYSAIDLFIARCLSSENISAEHLKCLNRLTGIEEQKTTFEWSDWRRSEGSRFTLDESSMNMLRQEAIEFAERSLFINYGLMGVMHKTPEPPFYSLEKIRELEKYSK